MEELKHLQPTVSLKQSAVPDSLRQQGRTYKHHSHHRQTAQVPTDEGVHSQQSNE